MTGSDEILTISYRGFTCALRGFDDPLQTMTAILDYLRYLEAIADTGGAGREAPDIDILTRIAERGVTRRVTVQSDDGGVLLCADPSLAADRVAPPPGQAPDRSVAPPVPDRPASEERPDAPARSTAMLPSARVVRVRRSDLDRLVDRGILRQDTGDGPAPPVSDASRQDAHATLCPEAERALQRELAAIETDTPHGAGLADDRATAPTDSARDGAHPAASEAATGVTGADRAPGHDMDDLSRIFEKTDSHLDAPSSNRRRSTIQYLRAALALTRTETQTDRGATRPQRRGRPARQRWQGAREAGRWPDPLRLMPEQRVMGAPDAGPVQFAASSAQGVGGDFGAFVARRGAAELPDLIEAAAAYMVDIEGHVRFSRPMLMEMLDQIGVTAMREDMLRACDAVLTAGKLRKCSDGRYTVTDATGFRTRPGTG